MNKDVIYIEPEDDITDIITKIENSKSKIVALVPPKKAGVFRSVVNIKLIAKVGASAKKTIVLVTTDPSIVKIAAVTKIPVAKNLQSAPVVPVAEVETNDTTESVEEPEEEEKKDDDDETDKETAEDAEKGNGEEEPEEDEKAEEKKSSKKKSGKTSNKFVGWIKDHKKIAIFAGVGIVVLILFLIWALAIAPAATLTIEIKTNLNNFSEGIGFTTKLDEENIEEGKFYLDEKKIESVQETKFEATGKKKVGEKARGEVVIYTYFPLNVKGTTVVNAGEKFTISGLAYVADASVALVYNGNSTEGCDNKENSKELVELGCQVSARVDVVAAEPGSDYNIAASSSGWSAAGVRAYSDKAMSGGTDDTVTVVQQSDIDKAKAELATTDETKNKEDLIEQAGKDALIITSSFIQTTSEASSTPAVGEEVKEGTEPVLKATTVASIYVIDKVKVEEFITKKANLGDNQKIYDMKDPFIENFMKTDSGFSGKLKTSYSVGPKITENDVIAIVKGKGKGEAQHDLKDINGIGPVRIDTSFPWVMSIPNDPNKITIVFEIKDQNGNKIEQKKDDSKSTETNDEDSTKDNTDKEEKK